VDLETLRRHFSSADPTFEQLQHRFGEVLRRTADDLEFVVVVEGDAEPVAWRWYGVLFAKDERV
jgi:hypothetical protein